ncbi:helix-turn-helix domain-containing protein [Glycomyces salinus]|uniref:helix-turn-helix domain-containing protein n=1 Tax=Glycomyces salinus TaxID=980294 RepID=UPI0018EAC0E8|nr:helix-turn-helix transcriptional regulator [Glycomyces salinus]
MALVCGTCGTELHDGSSCVACRAADGLMPALPGAGPARVAVLAWLQPRAQAALATGRLSLILRTWRSITGTQQAEIADALGYTTTYLSKIENNRRDITNLADRRRIADYLGLAPHVLGVTDEQSGDYRTMLEFGEATLRLAAVARNAGRPAAALNELWPLIQKLEDRVQHGYIDPGMVSLLARARSALGVYLGDILPAQGLAVSSRWTGRALALTERLGDADLHARALRSHGNELRKAGNLEGAIRRLRQSAELAHNDLKPTVLTALARAAAEADAPELFDEVVADARRLADTTAPSALFNGAIVAEVHLRGLLHLGRKREAARILEVPIEGAAGSAPQWRAIAMITKGEVLAETGATEDAARLLPQAVNEARACRLPQQLQRIARLAKVSPSLEAIAMDSRTALGELAAAKPGTHDHRIPQQD